jgi:hypothetical protein
LCIIAKFIREEAQKLAFGEEDGLTAFDSLIVSFVKALQF